MKSDITPMDVIPDPELLQIIGAVAAAAKAYSSWLSSQEESSCYKENTAAFLSLERDLDNSASSLVDLLSLKLQYEISG